MKQNSKYNFYKIFLHGIMSGLLSSFIPDFFRVGFLIYK